MMPIPFKHLGFLGTPDFAADILAGLLKNSIPIAFVITAPDRPKGRGYTLTPPPVKNLALENKIPCFQPDSKELLRDVLQEQSPDLLIVVAYGLIFPPDIVRHYRLINLHGSLLPRHRGASPIQTAIMEGDAETGPTLMRIAEGLDDGDIIAATSFPIEAEDTSATIFEKMVPAGIELLMNQLQKPWDSWNFTPQNESLTTVTKKIRKEAGLVDLTNDDPQVILRKLRAYTPWPGIYTFVDDKRVKILNAEIRAGKLKLLSVQPEGKKAVSYEDYLRGNAAL